MRIQFKAMQFKDMRIQFKAVAARSSAVVRQLQVDLWCVCQSRRSNTLETIQYDLNNSVVKKRLYSDEARTAALNEGKELLSERNKHILLAEKFGWDTVECYSTEPLAKEADDERRVNDYGTKRKRNLCPQTKPKGRIYGRTPHPSKNVALTGHHLYQQMDFWRESPT